MRPGTNGRTRGSREPITGSKDLTVGMPVWVSKDYKEPDLRGHVGKIERCYGGVSYAAFEVRFWDGRSKLFWHDELEGAYQRTR